MNGYKTLFTTALLLIIAPALAHAQDTLKQAPAGVVAYIGIRTDGDKVTRDEALQLAGLPLRVKDSKNNEYVVDNYHFAYRRKSYIPHPETGNPQPTFTLVSQRFVSTPLPKVWIDNIREDLKPEEEFLFFDIVVRDKKGAKYIIPSLKIIVQ